MDKHILVFGTSTTYGAWDIEGGWVQRLRKFFDQKTIDSNYQDYYLVYNLGVSGDKSTNILERFESETRVRTDLEDKNQETIILFHLGINDCIYNEGIGGLEVSQEDFKNNYIELIGLAKNYSQKIVVIGSMPTDSRVDPIPWAPGRHYRNEDVKKYNQIMEEVAKETEVEFLEIYEKFINQDYSSLLADGVHMSSEGHRQFYEIVKDYLLENKII